MKVDDAQQKYFKISFKLLNEIRICPSWNSVRPELWSLDCVAKFFYSKLWRAKRLFKSKFYFEIPTCSFAVFQSIGTNKGALEWDQFKISTYVFSIPFLLLQHNCSVLCRWKSVFSCSSSSPSVPMLKIQSCRFMLRNFSDNKIPQLCAHILSTTKFSGPHSRSPAEQIGRSQYESWR